MLPKKKQLVLFGLVLLTTIFFPKQSLAATVSGSAVNVSVSASDTSTTTTTITDQHITQNITHQKRTFQKSNTRIPTISFHWITPTPRQRVYTTTTPTTHSPTATPTPTIKPIGTPTLSRKPMLASTTTSSFLDDKQTYMLNAINAYRRQNGLSDAKGDKYTCSFASIRAKEIVTGFNHDGFQNRVNTHSLPYPSYSLVTENIAMTSNYKEVVSMWTNSSGHAANMRANTPYICVGYSGNYYAMEGWKP